MFKVGDKVRVTTGPGDPVRLQTHRHALVFRVDGEEYWVGHAQDYALEFGPFPAGQLTRGWGESGGEAAAVRGLCVGGWS